MNILICTQETLTEFSIMDFVSLFGLSIAVGILTTILINYFWCNKGKYSKKLLFKSWIQGTLEILAFSFSILIGIPFFIAFWITVKTAMRWDLSAWTIVPKNDDKEEQLKIENEKDQQKKNATTRFLFGNIINVILSYLIACYVCGGLIHFFTIS